MTAVADVNYLGTGGSHQVKVLDRYSGLESKAAVAGHKPGQTCAEVLATGKLGEKHLTGSEKLPDTFHLYEGVSSTHSLAVRQGEKMELSS